MSLESAKIVFISFLSIGLAYILAMTLIVPEVKEEEDYNTGLRHGLFISWLLSIAVFSICFYIVKIKLP